MGLIFERTKVVKYIEEPGVTCVVVPDGVTVISSEAFSGCSRLEEVILPEGLEKIGSSAFEGCLSLTRLCLPHSLRIILSKAFKNCTGLKEVTLPEGLKALGLEAFAGCTGLERVYIPDRLSFIAPETFTGCTCLGEIIRSKDPDEPGSSASAGQTAKTEDHTPENIPDGKTASDSGAGPGDSTKLIIQNHVVIACTTNAAEVTIPDGVTEIGRAAFEHCHGIKKVIFPEGLQTIGWLAFRDCRDLEEIALPEGVSSIGLEAFRDCGRLKSIEIPASVRSIEDRAFADCPRLERIINRSPVRLYKSMVGSCDRPVYTNDPARLPIDWGPYAVLCFAANPSDGDAERRQKHLEYIARSQRILLPFEEKHPELKAMLQKLAAADPELQKALKGGTDAERSEAEALYQQLGGSKQYDMLRLSMPPLPDVKRKDGAAAEENLLKALILAYGSQYRRAKELTVQRISQADRLAEALDPASFQQAVETIRQGTNLIKNPRIILFLVRYGSGTTLKETAKTCRGIWTCENSVKAGYLLNDSHEAMLMADRKGQLGQYAAMRGMTEAQLLETVFSDFGFDENGEKCYDLGNVSVIVRLDENLKLQLSAGSSGKPLRTLPTKGTDPEKRSAAMEDLKDMRTNLKRVLASQSDRVLAAFLSGEPRPAASWAGCYRENPVLRALANHIVWQQGDRTFILNGRDPVDSSGMPCPFTDEPVSVPHPMDLTAEETQAWQKYFMAHGLRQPFEQIWEPVYEPGNIYPDRYEGAVVPFKYLVHRQKHGIDASVRELYWGTSSELNLRGCELTFEEEFDDTLPYDYGKSEPEKYSAVLGTFSFREFNRQVNHIVYLLDRVTVGDRIRKNDVTVLKLATNFSLPQLMEYIHIATEAGSAEILAGLLQVKQDRFGTEDIMDVFTLDDL